MSHSILSPELQELVDGTRHLTARIPRAQAEEPPRHVRSQLPVKYNQRVELARARASVNSMRKRLDILTKRLARLEARQK